MIENQCLKAPPLIKFSKPKHISDLDLSGSWTVTHGLNPSRDCFPFKMYDFDRNGLVKSSFSPFKDKRLPLSTRYESHRVDGYFESKYRVAGLNGKEQHFVLASIDEFILVVYFGSNESTGSYIGGYVASRNFHKMINHDVIGMFESKLNEVGLGLRDFCEIPHEA